MVAKYSALCHASAIIPCSFEDQDMAPGSYFDKVSLVDLPLSLHPLWSASESGNGSLDVGSGLASECILCCSFYGTIIGA